MASQTQAYDDVYFHSDGDISRTSYQMWGDGTHSVTVNTVSEGGEQVPNEINSFYGYYSTTDDADNQNITVDGITSINYIYAYGGVGTSANNNTVTIKNTSGVFNVYGGYIPFFAASSNSTNGNKVSIIDSNGETGQIYAANSYSGNASENELTIENSNLGYIYLYGGRVGSGDTGVANKNKVTIKGSSINNLDAAKGKLEANENVVTLTDSNIAYSIYISTDWISSGISHSDRNIIRLKNSKVTDEWASVYSGMGYNIADGNQLIIEDHSEVNGYAYAGSGGVGDTCTPETCHVNNNSVIIKNSFVNEAYAGYGAYSTGNSLDISDDSIVNSISVGFGYASKKSTYNTVNITDSKVEGGFFNIGSVNETNNNEVKIKNSEIYPDIIIGRAKSEYNEISETSKENTITIINSNMSNVYAGYAKNAINNHVIIKGDSTFSGEIYGGYSNDGISDIRTGNTLDIYSKGINFTGSGVYNFENYNFYLPSEVKDGDVIINNTENVSLGSDAKVNVAANKGVILNSGDQIVLINKVDEGSSTFSSEKITGGSFAVEYDFDVELKTDGKLTATVASAPKAAEETKSLSEGQSTSAAMVSEGTDLTATSGMRMAMAVTGSNLVARGFSAIGGGGSRYKTGSHVDVSGLSFMTGFAKRYNDGDALLGMFFEMGYSDYTSHNEFTSGNVKGKGFSSYYGLGIMGRYDFKGIKGLYAEGSVHGGYIRNNWHTNDLGGYAEYETGVAYYGGHVGVGHNGDINEKFAYDLYGKYFYNRQGSDNVTVLGEPFKFKDTDSHKSRIGSRISYKTESKLRPYIGAAWDHEFDSKAKTTTYGLDVPSPSIKGDTGVFEIGLETGKSKETGWNLDISIQGYVGKREGGSAFVKAIYEF